MNANTSPMPLETSPAEIRRFVSECSDLVLTAAMHVEMARHNDMARVATVHIEIARAQIANLRAKLTVFETTIAAIEKQTAIA